LLAKPVPHVISPKKLVVLPDSQAPCLILDTIAAHVFISIDVVQGNFLTKKWEKQASWSRLFRSPLFWESEFTGWKIASIAFPH